MKTMIMALALATISAVSATAGTETGSGYYEGSAKRIEGGRTFTHPNGDVSAKFPRYIKNGGYDNGGSSYKVCTDGWYLDLWDNQCYSWVNPFDYFDNAWIDAYDGVGYFKAL